MHPSIMAWLKPNSLDWAGYGWLAAIVSLVLAAMFLFRVFVIRPRNQRAREERYRHWWGRAQPREREFALYRLMLALRGDAADGIDEQTCADLDLDLVFSTIDRSCTSIGELELYRLLRTPSQESAPLADRDRLISLFETDSALRERLYFALTRLGRTAHVEGLIEILWGTLPAGSPWTLLYSALALAACLAVSSAVLLSASGQPANWLYALCLLIFIGHSLIHYAIRPQFDDRIRVLNYVSAMVACARAINGLSAPELAESAAALRDHAAALAGIRLSPVDTHSANPVANDVLGLANEYFSIFFLIEVRALYRCLRIIRAERAHLQALACALGHLDAMLSVASYRTSLPSYSKPTFAAETTCLVVEDAVHPLLPSAVPNSLRLVAKGCLITGPNMAGKTTFLRAIGILAIMAQSVATCRAKSYRGSFFRVMSSLETQDDLLAGRSYYLAEAARLLAMIRGSRQPVPALLLVDEILRGTNTKERLIVSREILAHLSQQRALVLAATHDVDLVESLGQAYDGYYFDVSASGNELSFDYTLHAGTSRARTAIALLECLEFPAEIIENSRRRYDAASGDGNTDHPSP